MEKMLNEYLQFTSSSYAEKDETFNISELIENIVKKYKNQISQLNSTTCLHEWKKKFNTKIS